MFHKCNVRDCVSSAKSFVIVFDDYEGYVTVPSLPKENGVPVKKKRNFIEISSGEFIFSKNNCVGFHRCVFRRDRAPRSCYQ